MQSKILFHSRRLPDRICGQLGEQPNWNIETAKHRICVKIMTEEEKEKESVDSHVQRTVKDKIRVRGVFRALSFGSPYRREEERRRTGTRSALQIGVHRLAGSG